MGAIYSHLFLNKLLINLQTDYNMESLFWGLGLLALGFLVDWLLNPVGVFTVTLTNLLKIIGIVLIVIGGIAYFSHNSSDIESIPRIDESHEIIDNGKVESNENNAVPINDYYNDNNMYPDYSSEEYEYNSQPVKQQCRACKGSGNCPVCGGNGQTNSRLGYSYSMGIQALPENCKSCGGSTQCSACGGDGWIDEGTDF